MPVFLVTFIVGVICIAIGISNMRGNISSLHSYHRNRVAEEDRIPFGKMVGLGTIIVGVAVIVNSVFSVLAIYLEKEFFVLIGTGAMIAGIVIGLCIVFYAMKKYNGGIF